MNIDYFNELKEEGYKYIEMKKEEYPLWNLWNSPETILIEGIAFKDVVSDAIYFFGTRYETEYDKDEDIVTAEKYENAVLQIDIHDSEDQDDVPNAIKLQEKINNGYIPKARDILGKIAGAGTWYDFVIEGEQKETFKCDDIVIYLEKKYEL